MDKKTLVTEQIDAGAELIKRFDEFMPVQAAFWLKPEEDARWSLYIASDRIDPSTLRAGFGEVVRLAQEINDPYLDMFQVDLIPADDPRARDVMEVYRRYPGKIPKRYPGTTLGGMSIDEAYLYPLPIQVANS